MMIRTLNELMDRNPIRGFQCEDEIDVAKKLIDKVGSEEAERLWSEGCKTIEDRNSLAWNTPDTKEEFLTVLVSNLTKPIEDLTLNEIIPSSYSTDRELRPIIVFMVG